jgi:hypothetical protein
MLELMAFFLIVVPAIAVRAKQRGVNRIPYVSAAIVGFLLFLILGFLGLGVVALVLRWIWVGGVYLVVEFLANRGRKASGTWQCPSCKMFNDLRTLSCLCGTTHESTVTSARDPQAHNTPGQTERP